MDNKESLDDSLLRLDGKVVLVSGTTSGLGERFARVVAAAGGTVALTGRRRNRLDTLRETIVASGGHARTYPLDVTDPDQIASVVSAVEQELGPINVLINNAGMATPAPAVDQDIATFDNTMRTNAHAAFYMAKEIGSRMILSQRGGEIINIASTGGQRPMSGFIAYCMSKAAMIMMTKVLAKEWAGCGINVNAICPGSMRTEINEAWLSTELGQTMIDSFPRRRVGEPADIDDLVLLLCSGRLRLLTGAEITIDDGQTL